ncbi:MAG: ABC transporter permease [Boseongicola sp. SB0675_bin_26]|nr:ABC transporter permease [Boseongicola sp. SB0675_bin_26]
MTRPLRAECALELKTLVRQPGFWVPTVLFPAMLYAFFGAQSAGDWAANAMAAFAVYAVLGVGFFQFGVSVAQDRESPFAKWQQTLPGHAGNQWIARVLASLVFVTVAVALVVALAFVLGRVEVGAAALVRLAFVCLIASFTATFMGIALGSLASARAAVPLANLIFLPLAYLGGLWVPPMALPSAVNAVSQWTPTRAMGELGWAAIAGTRWDPGYLAVLLGWTVISVAVVVVAHARHRRHE